MNPLWLYVAAHVGWMARSFASYYQRERRSGKSARDVFRPNRGKPPAPRVPSPTEVA